MKRMRGIIEIGIVAVLLVVLLSGTVRERMSSSSVSVSSSQQSVDTEGSQNETEPEELLQVWEELGQAKAEYLETTEAVEFDEEDPTTWRINPDYFVEVGDQMIDPFFGIVYELLSVEYVESMEDYPSGDYCAYASLFLSEAGELTSSYVRTYESEGEIICETVEQGIILVTLSASNPYDMEIASWLISAGLHVLGNENGTWYYVDLTAPEYEDTTGAQTLRSYANGTFFYCKPENRTGESGGGYASLSFAPGETYEVTLAFLVDRDLLDSTVILFNLSGSSYAYYNMGYYMVMLEGIAS